MKWPMVQLGQLAEIVGGSTPRRDVQEYWGEGHYWATPTDLPMPGEGIMELERTKESISDIGLNSSSANLLPIGTVLYSTRATIGKLAIANVPVATNQGFNNFIVGEQVINRYLAYALQYFTPEINQLAGTTTFKEVTRSALRGFRIPLPAKKEQSRIVELLDESYRLRLMRRELDIKVEQILPSLFLNMFGEPLTNPNGWAMKPLGELADQKPEYGANASACLREPGMPRYVRITDIQTNGTLSDKGIVSLELPDWSRYSLNEGDVLFARSGNTVGKTYIYRPSDGQCAFAGYLIRFQFRTGAVDPWFIFGLTQTPYYRDWVESNKRVAGQPNINGQEYAGLLIPVPSQSLQRKFGELAKKIDSLQATIYSSAEKLEATFSTLMQHAFTGQLTEKWCEGRMLELLAEMEIQARALNLQIPKELEVM